jgi:hypothetical protein
VLVALTDHRRVEVSHASVRADTLLGDTLSVADGGRGGVPVPVAIPFGSIDSVFVRGPDRLGNAVLAMAGAAVLAAVLVPAIDDAAHDAANKADAQMKESCHGVRID